MTAAPCPLCAAPTERVLSSTLRRGTGTVFHCEACDLGFLVAEPVPKAYYDGAYRERVSHRADGSATNPQELYDVYSRYQGGRLRLISEVAPMLPSRYPSMLEIGASAGQFLTHFDAWQVRRCAVEPDRACCAFMEKMGIETDSNVLSESKFSREKFDIVCGFQVLEHVSDPVQFLRDVRAVMKPGGVAFVEVPNLYDPLRSVWAIPEYDVFYFHSDHLFYFSRLSLCLAASAAGFKNQEVRFTHDYNLLNAISWVLTKWPQADCHVGLGPVKLTSLRRTISSLYESEPIAEWLSGKLSNLNEEYIAKLEAAGKTSNLMLILKKE